MCRALESALLSPRASAARPAEENRSSKRWRWRRYQPPWRSLGERDSIKIEIIRRQSDLICANLEPFDRADRCDQCPRRGKPTIRTEDDTGLPGAQYTVRIGAKITQNNIVETIAVDVAGW